MACGSAVRRSCTTARASARWVRRRSATTSVMSLSRAKVIASEIARTGALSTTTTAACALILARVLVSTLLWNRSADWSVGLPTVISLSPGTSVATATSSIEARPASRSARPGRAPVLNTVFSAGRRRSASTRMTERPACASAVARLAATEVRPSRIPPLATSRTVLPSETAMMGSSRTRR